MLEPPPAARRVRSTVTSASASSLFYASRGTRSGSGSDARRSAADVAWRSRTRPADDFVAEEASRLLADGRSILPRAFDRRFANPCWRCAANATSTAGRVRAARRAPAAPADAAGGLCCLPYAHILGVSKCGTTDLHSRLAAHPRVLPTANKGPHFWDSAHSLDWYLGLYAQGAQRLEDGRAHPDSIFLDASSNTLTYTGIGVRNVASPAPPVTLPHVMRWLQPSVKLLLMLREPAARYYSAYRYYNKRYRIYERFGPLGAEAFGAMVLADIDAYSRCRQAATARRCARTVYHQAEQLVKGIYALFLEGWLDAFPPEQLLVIRLDDYERELARHLEIVISFLEMPPPPRRVWRRMLDRPRANRQLHGEPMLESTRDVLRIFYAEHNEHLAVLLGDARYREWHEGPSEDGKPPGAMRASSVWGTVG